MKKIFVLTSMKVLHDNLSPPKASDWGTADAQHRKWKISDIGTFASNIGVILYQCSNGTYEKNCTLQHIKMNFRNKGDAGS